MHFPSAANILESRKIEKNEAIVRTLCGFTPLHPPYTLPPRGSRGGSPEYYGCYTPISGRFRRDPDMQGFIRFEEMSVPLVEMKILM